MSPVMAFLAGDRSASVLDALADAMLRWATQEPDRPQMAVNRFLGIPPSPCKMRRLLRDLALQEAGDLVGGDTPWDRSCRLAEAARAFELRRWPLWRTLPNPPAHAVPVDAALWQARRFAEFPCSARQFHNLLL